MTCSEVRNGSQTDVPVPLLRYLLIARSGHKEGSYKSLKAW